MNGQRQIALGGRDLTLEDVLAVARGSAKVTIKEPDKERIAESSRALKKQVADTLADKTNRSPLQLKQRIMYGTTTGFGELKTEILKDPDSAKRLQENLVLSHAAGVGPLFDRETTRAIMLLRANTLATGYCGISLEVVEQLLALIENEVWPSIPEQGSVGASGDLAPLSHLALGLIGQGEVWRRAENGHERFDSLAKLTEVYPDLKHTIRNKLDLGYKDGLALINGLSVMTGIGVLAHADAKNLLAWADAIGAVTLESLLGCSRAFDDIVFTVYGHQGARTTAATIKNMIDRSELINRCNHVHDPYSLRCMPQVHGAVRDALAYVETTLANQLNTIDDDPIFFREDEIEQFPPLDSTQPPLDENGERTDGAAWKQRRHFEQGNFHGEPIAFAMDLLAMTVAELANVSERRIQMLLDRNHNRGLPSCLVDNPDGVNSGYMIGQYTAAALVSENKSLCHPASVDSIPTSANAEDHVSMGTIAARKARRVVENVKNVLAIELLCATEALSYRLSDQTMTQINEDGTRTPKPVQIHGECGTGTRRLYDRVRKGDKAIEFLNGEDKILHELIQKARGIISDSPSEIVKEIA